MSVLREVGMVTVGGVDTYYDYDEQRWKYRRLGGGPVRLHPAADPSPDVQLPREVEAQLEVRAGAARAPVNPNPAKSGTPARSC